VPRPAQLGDNGLRDMMMAVSHAWAAKEVRPRSLPSPHSEWRHRPAKRRRSRHSAKR
jgi:hypothetical protein